MCVFVFKHLAFVLSEGVFFIGVSNLKSARKHESVFGECTLAFLCERVQK